MIIYFGAAGGGRAYSHHSGQLPNFFVDNDSSKWGTKLLGINIESPSFLSTLDFNDLDKIVITSGYIKSIFPQLIEIGIPQEKIIVPAKSTLGEHPFKIKEDRVETSSFLSSLMISEKKFSLVAVGGTALGFSRDRDFIVWDYDIDLFAPQDVFEKIFDELKDLNCSPFIEGHNIKASLKLKSEIIVPIGIDFFDPYNEYFLDTYEDHEWVWPTSMFTNPLITEIHSFPVFIPNPPDRYLTGIYGNNWQEPNQNFNYYDYNSVFKKNTFNIDGE